MAQTCPSCGAAWTAGSSACVSCGARASAEFIGVSETIPPVPSAAPGTVPCPMCSEPVAPGSTRCKWCGENLNQKPTGVGAPTYQPQPQGRPQPRPQIQPANQPPRPDPNTALILGIIAISGLFCAPTLILGPFAWMAGNSYEKACAAAGLVPEGTGRAGKVLGIVSTIILGLGVLLFLLYIGIIVLAIGAAAASG